MKQTSIKLIVIVIAGLFLLSLLKGSADSQSFWERRQKSQEDLRKKSLGKDSEEKPGTETAVPKAEEKAPSAVTGLDEEEDFLLFPELDEEEGEAFEPTPFPLLIDPLDDLGNKNITKIADKDTVINPDDIKVNDAYGSIKTVFVAKDWKDKPFIIHIQDAHVNYDAQVSIAHLVEELLENYGINVVCVEGGIADDQNLNQFRLSGPRANRIEVAKKYLKNGEFSGVEYLYGVTGYPLLTRGIEEEKVYLDQMDAYHEIDSIRQKARDYMDSLKTNIDNLKSAIFSKELNELETNRSNYIADKMSLTDYTKFLSEKTKDLDIEVKDKFSNLAHLMETVEMEDQIDFPGVDVERGKLIDTLNKSLKKSQSDELNDKLIQFRTGDIKASEFYTYLSSLNKGDLSKDYPNLALYTKYITTFDKIDTYKLFKEIDDLEKEVKAKLYENKDQEQLDKISTDFAILREFIELGLTPDEYSYYRDNESEITPDNWIPFIKKKSKEHKLKKSIPGNKAAVDKIIPKLQNFYKIAILRDKVLVERTLAQINNSKSKIAIMVAGGFHTPRITGIMRTLGVSYVVIAPKITNPTEPGLYDKVLKEQKEYREQGR
ncbi:MAG: hypothetical protein ABII27_05250 [bacterium]